MTLTPISAKPQSGGQVQPVDASCSVEKRLLAPNGFLYRPRTYYLPELKTTLNEAYSEWKHNLPEAEYQALLTWYSGGFKAINAQFRKDGAAAPEQLKESILALTRAINLAPAIPPVVTELFRGESHQLLTLEEAQRKCCAGFTTNLSESFLATSIFENEAFNFARDYHASGFTDCGLMIPIGALQKPVEQQIIYRYILPENRTGLRAAWIGQTIGEMLFLPNTYGQWLQAEQVAYIPADEMEDLMLGRRSESDLANNAEYRLLVTIQLLPGSADPHA